MKVYPQRTQDIEAIGKQLIEVCECGHAKHDHSVIRDRECDLCTCPIFKFEQMLTRNQVLELRMKLDIEADKTGFRT